MKNIKSASLVIVLALAGLAQRAAAVPTITISDGINPPITVVDHGVGDRSGASGAITTITNVGAWSVVVCTGITKPAHGSAAHPLMDLSVQAGGMGNLTVTFSDRGFGPSAGNFNGTVNTRITGRSHLGPAAVGYQVYDDPENTVGGMASLLADTGTGLNGSSSGSLSLASGFSLTQVVTIGAPAGTFVSLDASLSTSSVITNVGNPVCANYPITTGPNANAFTMIPFTETEILVTTNISSVNGVPTAVQAFYSDEHALLLGVRQVVTGVHKALAQAQASPSTNNFSVSAMHTNTPYPDGIINPAVGATADQGGVDISCRPIFPSLFVTDITDHPSNPFAGDWQYGGKPQQPTAVFGWWKSAVIILGQTSSTNCSNVTVVPDNDPPFKPSVLNYWNFGPGSDPFPSATRPILPERGYSAEVRWDIASLVDNFGQPLKAGHTYHLYFFLHDGDQNKPGGEAGQSCLQITMPPNYITPGKR